MGGTLQGSVIYHLGVDIQSDFVLGFPDLCHKKRERIRVKNALHESKFYHLEVGTQMVDNGIHM